jgi:hypothetical protein
VKTHIDRSGDPYREARLRPPRTPFNAKLLVRTAAVTAALSLGWLVTHGVERRTDQAMGEAAAAPRLLGEGPWVVNVWLQGCGDCATAFDAATALDREGTWARWPVVNVAYIRADPAWAAAHGVGRNLITDADGTGMVLPFGVTSFTTLVIGRDHRELLRDRPDRPGFAARVDEALRRAAH